MSHEGVFTCLSWGQSQKPFLIRVILTHTRLLLTPVPAFVRAEAVLVSNRLQDRVRGFHVPLDTSKLLAGTAPSLHEKLHLLV